MDFSWTKLFKIPSTTMSGKRQFHFGNQLFQLDGTCVRFLNDRVAVPCHCGRTAALLHLLLRLLRLRLWASGLRGAECLRCTVWSVSLPFFFPNGSPSASSLGLFDPVIVESLFGRPSSRIGFGVGWSFWKNFGCRATSLSGCRATSPSGCRAISEPNFLFHLCFNEIFGEGSFV